MGVKDGPRNTKSAANPVAQRHVGALSPILVLNKICFKTICSVDANTRGRY